MPAAQARIDSIHRARGALVNDVHSRLNPTTVRAVVAVRSVEEVQELLAAAAERDLPVCIAGGRHAMGGQQFGTAGVLLDTRGLDRVRAFDPVRGLVEVEAGIQWPELIAWLLLRQGNAPGGWGIRQKQTGADRLSLGGAFSANIHGRGLGLAPFVEDVEACTLLDAGGHLLRCSREENPELFALAAGGYGLLGFVCTLTLRLARRHKVRRMVELARAEHLVARFEERRAQGCTFGDFQFAIDPASPDFLSLGILSCYQPVGEHTPGSRGQRVLNAEQWQRLLLLAHTDKSAAFRAYADHYLATDGQVYASDLHQLTTYLEDYHEAIDRERGTSVPSSEMISELCVPRTALAAFLAEAAADFRRHGVDCIYGTVRLIERDETSFLAWARETWACVIFNLHVEHTPQGLSGAAAAFRRLIDMAARRGGTYYLTYHRFATREQAERCHPRLRAFLDLKRSYDPEERFQSDWYRHHRALLGADASAPVPR